MTLTEYPQIVQRSDEWYDQRRGMVTASAVSALLTSTLKVADNDYSRGLTASLVAERISGFTEPTYLSNDMIRGIDDEPIARDLYAEHCTTEKVTESGFMVRDLGIGNLGFSPDGLVGSDGLLEIKSRRGKKHVRTVLDGNVPPENLAQCQAGLLVSGRKWLDYVSFSGGLHLWVKRIYPDIQWFEAITQAVAAFEKTAEQMTSDYLAAVDGLPMTERTVELEMSL